MNADDVRPIRWEPDLMTPGETACLRAMESTFPILDAWQARCARQPEEPQRGSELIEDDRVWPQHRISEMARLSLALSVEHLRLIRVMLDARQLFPSAPFTTLRGALVGAAQAVWVLSPDDRETRQSRGLCVIAEEYAQLAKFYSEADQIKPDTIPTSQWSWLNERTRALAAVRGAQPPPLVQTSMIGHALDAAFPNQHDKRSTGRLLWRQMSADAHVLGWAVSQRTSIKTPAAKGADLAVLAAPGSLEHLSDPFLCAYELARCGWSLFDRRCEANS
jgi:hypothetical protein